MYCLSCFSISFCKKTILSSIKANCCCLCLYNLNLEHPNCFLIHNSRLIHFSAIYLYNQKQFKVPRFIILELIKHNTKIFSNNRNGIKAFDTNMMFYGFTVDAEKKDGKRYTKDGKRYDVDEAKTYVNSKL